MSRQRVALFLLLIVVNYCVGAPSASSQNLTDEWVEKAAGPLIENRTVDGLSIGYIEGDHWGIVHLGSSTHAGKNANNLTLYELGSISKVFTSLLLAEAAVRGEIDLDAAADVPNPAQIRFPSRDGKSIKWIDLSTHRAGLPKVPDNLQPTDLKNPYRDYDSKLAAAYLNQFKLPRPPGEAREYSNFGASVLGYLIAEKVGKSYEQLLRERITEPLRMSDCTVALSSDQRKRFATPHDKVGSPTSPWTFADLPGAGGIRATMRDMMRFAKAQLNPPSGKLGDAIELAWKQQRDADASGPAMGLGWIILADGETRWHNGGTGGSSSAIFIDRQRNCAVIVLCNTSVTNIVEPLAMQLLAKAKGQIVALEPGKAADPDPDSNKLDVDAKLRSRLVGRYQLTPAFIFDVQDRDGHLRVGITNQPTQEVFPDSPTRWSYRGVDATLQFKLPETGSAESLVLHQNGIEQTAPRISEPAAVESDKLSIDANLRDRLVGRYQLAPEFIFDVSDRDGQLMVGATNQPSLEVQPDSPTRWTSQQLGATIEFDLPKTGPANSLVLHQGGAQQTAKRIENDLAIDAKLRGRLVGRYQILPNFIFDVQDRDGQLMVGITDQPTLEVHPDSPTRWHYREIDATLEFQLPKTGRARSLILHQNGAAQTARRIR